MKRLTIICEDKWIDEARERAKLLFKHDVLKIPVSETGELPATHWICTLHLDDEKFDSILNLKNKSMMFEMSSREVLKEMNLKKIE
jgi:hypothetical protein